MELIIACDPTGGIGYQGGLPWTKIEGDLPRFKRLTENRPVVMGRNTWDSLPKKPLPNRINVVVTSRPIEDKGQLVIDPDEIFAYSDWYCVIGGAKLISACWKYINKIYITITNEHYTCDTYIDLQYMKGNFNVIHCEQHSDHRYEIWERK